MFSYFDSHSHLNLSPLAEEKDKIIKILEEEKIGTITVGTDYETSLAAVTLTTKSKNLYACVGLHPTESETFDYEKFKKLASDPKVVAIGECGLDYFHLRPDASPPSPGQPIGNGSAELVPELYLTSQAVPPASETVPGSTLGRGSWRGGEAENAKKRQKENFEKQIALARELKLPLMIHCRPSKNSMDAYRDLIEILKSYPGVTGNSHFFAGNLEIAKEFLNIGFTLSFAGPITFVPDYDRVIEYAPLEMLLSETDAPFAAPAPYRGKTCYPQYVKEVVRRIAEIKKISLEDTKRELVANAKRVFGL